jgi:methyl-coenzyme M reductase gamma subunit
MKVNKTMAYKPQYGPGTSKVAENRRKQMNPNQKLKKMRDGYR